MRLEVDVPNPLNRRAWIFLNDVRQNFVLMADDELGEMDLLVVDDRGCFTLDERGEEVKTITLRGRVWIFDSRFNDFGKWEDV